MTERDGLNIKQARVVFHYTASVIRKKCRCANLRAIGSESKCSRCSTVDELIQAFPETWKHAADIVAQIGDTE